VFEKSVVDSFLLVVCGDPESTSFPDGRMEDFVEAAGEFFATEEAAASFATIKLICTEISLATQALMDSSLPPDVAAI